ncbi:MAG: HAMP domain-containing histidine kinase [Clostridia bacterium]|nr:HAMP domain-containing histidine kinase [Clostridia bacterium]
MKGRKLLKNLVGFLWFFLPVCIAVMVVLLTYSTLQEQENIENGTIAFVMLIVAFAISLFCAAIEFIRHKLTVERRVREILDGAQRIAEGDFSVRLPVESSWSVYDDFDRIKEHLNALASELSKTELIHSDFISSVSHEIKTPLSVIKSYALALEKGGRDEATVKKYARVLVEATDKLTALVTNILKLNKLENGEILPEMQTINAGEVLGECILTFEDAIEKKGLQLECDIDEVTLVAPEGYWEIICNNFISNAVKFTDAGGKISVSLKEVGGYIVGRFSDSGCGISKAEGSRIFDKFYQADTSHAKEGNGLGLALVKKVIQRMGGEIGVESELGKGSTFTVKLRSGV